MQLNEVLDKYPQSEDYLIEILMDYQKHKMHHDLTEEELKTIAQHLNIKESKISSVVTFYSLFSLTPKGQHVIQVCHDVPCHVNNQPGVLSTLKTMLNIDVGQTTDDKMFTLEYTSCLGACDKAPAMRIGEKTFTKLTPNKIKAIIAEYRGRKHA